MRKYLCLGILWSAVCLLSGCDITTENNFEETTSSEVQTVEETSEATTEEAKELESITSGGTVLDNETAHISYDGTEQSPFGEMLKFTVENKTNRTIKVKAVNSEIDGYMCEAELAVAVDALSKGEGIMSVDGLSDIGLKEAPSITFTPLIYDLSSAEDISKGDPVKIIIDEKRGEPSEPKSKEIFSDSCIKLSYVKVKRSDYGTELLFFAENRTNEPMSVDFFNVKINGESVNPMVTGSLNPNTKGMLSMSLYMDMDKLPDVITDMSLTVEAYNRDNYNVITNSGEIKFTV